MFYKKQLITKSPTHKRIVFDDFSGGMSTQLFNNLSTEYASVCFNFSGKNGVLKQSVGFDKFSGATVEIPESKAVWMFKMWDKTKKVDANFLFVMDKDNIVQYLQLGKDGENFKTIPDIILTETPTVASYKFDGVDMLLFFTADKGLYVWDGAQASHFESPKVKDAAIHHERVFAAVEGEDRKLWFSQELDPRMWETSITKGGWWELPDNFGKIEKVCSFDNYVVVFGSDKIAELTASESQADFRVHKVFKLQSAIYKKTVAVCGDTIVFLTANGLYAYDGNSVKRILQEIDGLFDIDNDSAIGVFLNGQFCLTAKMNFNDSTSVMCEKGVYENNGLVMLDTEKLAFNVSRGMDITHFCSFKNHLLFVANGRVGELSDSGKYFETSLPKSWQTAESDFGAPFEKKLLREMSLFTEYPMTLKALCDGNEKVFQLNGKRTLQKLKLNLSGYFVKICFFSDSEKPNIIKPVLNYDLI